VADDCSVLWQLPPSRQVAVNKGRHCLHVFIKQHSSHVLSSLANAGCFPSTAAINEKFIHDDAFLV
jgi:hypothetical protein